MSDIYAPTKRSNKVADWLEVVALVRGISMGSDALHEAGVELGLKVTDVDVGLNNMARRAAVLGTAYPFTVGSGIAAKAGAEGFPWTSMLLMSAESPARASLDVNEAALQLEKIVCEALKALYGPGTSALRFAWPSDEGRPQEFPDAVRWLAGRMNIPCGSAYRPPYTKDGGVDVVAWRPFPDGRSGFPVMLAQVTIEKDYVHKARDVDIRIWSGWLALDHDPSTALAIPEVVASGEDWRSLAARTVVLDRLRLASLLALPGARPSTGASWTDWAAGQIANLRGST